METDHPRTTGSRQPSCGGPRSGNAVPDRYRTQPLSSSSLVASRKRRGEFRPGRAVVASLMDSQADERVVAGSIPARVFDRERARPREGHVRQRLATADPAATAHAVVGGLTRRKMYLAAKANTHGQDGDGGRQRVAGIGRPVHRAERKKAVTKQPESQTGYDVSLPRIREGSRGFDGMPLLPRRDVLRARNRPVPRRWRRSDA